MALWAWGYGTNQETEAWAFVVDFGEYAGGLGRAVTAWVTGQADENCTEAERALQDLFNQEYPAGTQCPADALYQTRTIESGEQACWDIAPTPGRVNDGAGRHKDASAQPNPDRRTYPAFESVAIFLSRRPTDKEARFLVDRALRFHEAPKHHEWEVCPRVLRCRLVREVTRVEYLALL